MDTRVQAIVEQRRMMGLPAVSASLQDKKDILQAMISEILIDQAVKEAKIQVGDAEIQSLLNQQKTLMESQVGAQLNEAQFKDLIERNTGTTWQEYIKSMRTEIARNRFIVDRKKSLFDSLQPPSEEDIQDTYDELIGNITNPQYSQYTQNLTNPELIRIQHLFINTFNLSQEDQDKAFNRAQELYRKLQNGTDTFTELIENYSEDTNTKYKGGDLGYIPRNDRTRAFFGDNFFRKVFALDQGQVSGVIMSNNGYHIVKVTEKRKAKILDIDDPLLPGETTTVRDYISALLRQQNEQQALERAVNEIVTELKNRAEINIIDSAIQ